MKNLLGKIATTIDGHYGVIIDQYKPTGKNEKSVHIQERDGRIWSCPISNVIVEE